MWKEREGTAFINADISLFSSSAIFKKAMMQQSCFILRYFADLESNFISLLCNIKLLRSYPTKTPTLKALVKIYHQQMQQSFSIHYFSRGLFLTFILLSNSFNIHNSMLGKRGRAAFLLECRKRHHGFQNHFCCLWGSLAFLRL